MSQVKVQSGESIDSALKRFKKECMKSGIFSEVRERRFYEKPSVKRKRKQAAAERKMRRKLAKLKKRMERY